MGIQKAGQWRLLYVYKVPVELPLNPQRKQEISECGWFDLDELRNLHVNVDVSNFRTLMR
jgi:hypothetical protein